MPALAPYIPNQDAKLNLWLDNFATLTSATPALYGLTSLQAANIASAVGAWTVAYAPTTSPSTKTAAAVSAKNTQKVTVLALVRPVAQTVSLNPGVESSDKIALGLNPRTSTPSPITPPTSNPVLTVQSASNLTVILRYRDSAASVSVKGKPYGARQCLVYFAVSATPVTDPSQLAFYQVATKSPFVLSFGGANGGKQVYLAAKWSTIQGAVSPWSGIVSCTIPIVS